jgi:hypothetical protein
MGTADEDERAYFATFGTAVMSWNRAEGAMRQLLAGLCGGNTIEANMRAQIVTAELGSAGLTYALGSFAENLLPPEAAERVAHAVKYYNVLREYRNYYVHGLTSVVTGTQVALGAIITMTAKGKLIEHKDFIPVDKLTWLDTESVHLKEFTVAITRHLFWSGPAFGSPLSPLPHMQPVPDRLEKHRQPVRERFPPPQSSPA